MKYKRQCRDKQPQYGGIIGDESIHRCKLITIHHMYARGLINDAEDVVQKLNSINKPQSGAPGFIQWQ